MGVFSRLPHGEQLSPPSTEAAISRAACAGAPEILWRRGDGWIFNYVMGLQIGKWLLCL